MKENKFMSVSLANKSVVERITDQITNAIINGELNQGIKFQLKWNYVNHLV